MAGSSLDVWSRLLSAVEAGAPAAERDADLTLFQTSVGSAYDGQLMVVGRAVNGWIPRFTPTDLDTDAKRRALVDAERSRLAALSCQMGWVSTHWHNRSGYNTARSAFWRVIRGVVQGLGDRASTPWPATVAWSNLYRVSPYETGNPPANLARAQFPMAAELLTHDHRELRPQRVLFLTGLNWLHPFRVPLGLELAAVGADGVDARGAWGDATVVVAKHPQGKRERPMVDRILEVFNG